MRGGAGAGAEAAHAEAVGGAAAAPEAVDAHHELRGGHLPLLRPVQLLPRPLNSVR